MILRPHMAHDRSETTISFARRLGQFHTGRGGARRLLEDLGIDLRAFLSGAPDAVAILAAAADVDPEVLADSMIRRLDRCREFRGERWTRGFVLPEGARFCPDCLLEDGVAGAEWRGIGRIAWRLRPVLTCHRHHRSLITLPDAEAGDNLDHRFPGAAELREMAVETQVQVPTPLETMILDRLAGSRTTGGAWLEPQTLEQGVQVCEMIGATVGQGPAFDHGGLTPEDWRRAGAAGFAIASRGEGVVREALDGVASLSTTSSGKAGPKAIYGRLYEWLAYGSPIVDQGPIRAVLREHILDTLAIEPGELLLGERVEIRRLHSVHSLSERTGLHRKRLRKILVRTGMVSEASWDMAANRLVFPAQLAEDLCRDIVDAVSLHLVPEIIGCSRTQAESLYRVGVLRPVVDRDLGSGIGKIAFARRDLEGFLMTLSRLPLEVEGADGVVDLVNAAKRTGRTTGDLVARVLAGTLPAVRRRGDVGLAQIRIRSMDLEPLKVLVGAAIST